MTVEDTEHYIPDVTEVCVGCGVGVHRDVFSGVWRSVDVLD